MWKYILNDANTRENYATPKNHRVYIYIYIYKYICVYIGPFRKFQTFLFFKTLTAWGFDSWGFRIRCEIRFKIRFKFRFKVRFKFKFKIQMGAALGSRRGAPAQTHGAPPWGPMGFALFMFCFSI